MQDPLCTKTNKKESQKIEIIQGIVEKVLKIAKEEIDIDSGIDGVEKGLTPILGEIRKQVTEKMIEDEDVKAAICLCGKPMINKQKVPAKIIGLVPYEIKRRSFYCLECKIYEQPLDKVLKLNGRFSLEVKEAMVLLGQRLPFEEASTFLKTLFKVDVSHESIQTLVESVGKQIAKDEKRAVRKKVNSEGRIKNWKDTSEPLKKGITYMQMVIVQSRMKQAGMHWGKKNVQSILSLRAKYLFGGWNDIVDTYLKAA